MLTNWQILKYNAIYFGIFMLLAWAGRGCAL